MKVGVESRTYGNAPTFYLFNSTNSKVVRTFAPPKSENYDLSR